MRKITYFFFAGILVVFCSTTQKTEEFKKETMLPEKREALTEETELIVKKIRALYTDNKNALELKESEKESTYSATYEGVIRSPKRILEIKVEQKKIGGKRWIIGKIENKILKDSTWMLSEKIEVIDQDLNSFCFKISLVLGDNDFLRNGR